MSSHAKRHGASVAPALIAGVFVLVALLSTAGAIAQQVPPASPAASGGPVEVAQELYRKAFFAEAAQSLKAAFATGKVTPDDWLKANEWLARSLVRESDRVGARQVFRGMLDRDPEYRPDPLRIPQDERDVFDLAVADYRRWEIQQQRRIPVSFGMFFGKGSGGNSDFGELARMRGGDEHFKNENEFAGSVRFPIPVRSGGWSMDVALGRFKSTNFDTLSASSDSKVRYSSSALPLTISLVRAFAVRHGRLNVFVGGGPLLAAEINMRFLHNHSLSDLIPVTLAGRSTGLTIHGGLELEYPIQRRLSVTLRGLARHARTGEIEFERPNFLLYDPDPATRIGGRSLDFSGFSASAGLRAFVGF
ncbi:MAG: hypothetical protein ABIS67_13910 [Candidatus Eisenbacteria bacterium]